MAKYHNDSLAYRHFFSENTEFFANYGMYIIPGSKIIGDIGGHISGMPSNPLSLSFGAEYDGSALGALASSLQGSAAGAGGSFVQAGVGTVMEEFDMAAKTVWQTISKYDTSSKIPVSFEIIAFEEFSSISYKEMISRSLRLVEPKNLDNNLVTAPFDYKSGKYVEDINTDNTFSVVVGSHMLITHLLPTGFTYNYSSQKNTSGNPMYIKLAYSFITGRIMSADEIIKWWN